MCSLGYAAGRAFWWTQPRKRAWRLTPRFFSRTRRTPAIGFVTWRGRAMPFCLRDLVERVWSGHWRGSWVRPYVLLAFLRKAPSRIHAVPRVSVRDAPYRFRQPDGIVSLYCARAVAHRAAAGVSDRPVHPGRRPEIAHVEGRYADHGRPADHNFDRRAKIAVGQPAKPLDRKSTR